MWPPCIVRFLRGDHILTELQSNYVIELLSLQLNIITFCLTTNFIHNKRTLQWGQSSPQASLTFLWPSRRRMSSVPTRDHSLSCGLGTVTTSSSYRMVLLSRLLSYFRYLISTTVGLFCPMNLAVKSIS